MNQIGLKEVLQIFAALAETMTKNRDLLIEMDAVVGDGDLGITMHKAFVAADIEVNKLVEDGETDLAKLFMKAGMKMASTAPSTMGTLMGSGFMSGGKTLKGATGIGVKELAAFFTAYFDVVIQRGKAKLGDKTVLDVLKPVADKLTELSTTDASLKEALDAMLATSAESLEATRHMKAQVGKAATFAEKSDGLVDQGAYVIDLIVGCFHSII